MALGAIQSRFKSFLFSFTQRTCVGNFLVRSLSIRVEQLL